MTRTTFEACRSVRSHFRTLADPRPQDILNDNAHLLDSGNRKQRNKMFKAINNGDFSAYDEFEDDFSFASGCALLPLFLRYC